VFKSVVVYVFLQHQLCEIPQRHYIWSSSKKNHSLRKVLITRENVEYYLHIFPVKLRLRVHIVQQVINLLRIRYSVTHF